MERIVFLERNTIQANFRRPDFDHDWTSNEAAQALADQLSTTSERLSAERREICGADYWV
jgi:hypothetical protein